MSEIRFPSTKWEKLLKISIYRVDGWVGGGEGNFSQMLNNYKKIYHIKNEKTLLATFILAFRGKDLFFPFKNYKRNTLLSIFRIIFKY